MHVTCSCSRKIWFNAFLTLRPSCWFAFRRPFPLNSDSGFLLLRVTSFSAYNPIFFSFFRSFAVCIHHFATLIFYWWISFLPCREKKYFCCRTFRMNIIFEALCMLRGTDREHMCASTYVYVMQSEIYWNKIERERESGNKRKQSIEMKFRW